MSDKLILADFISNPLYKTTSFRASYSHKANVNLVACPKMADQLVDKSQCRSCPEFMPDDVLHDQCGIKAREAERLFGKRG